MSRRAWLRTGATVLIAAVAAAIATLASAAPAAVAISGAASGSSPATPHPTASTAPTGLATSEHPASATVAAISGAAAPALAIVVRDQTVLRTAPRASAQQLSLLWQGDVVEVRGERIDHLQVWDHGRERGGYVDASRVRRTRLAPDDAPELLASLRFVREVPGDEALGIALAAAYLKAASAEALRGTGGAEALDAIGTMADRLAERASSGGAAPVATAAPSRADVAMAAHLETVARHGVAFRSFERDGAMRICYDGDAFRRVLASSAAAPVARARAALGLTRPECVDPALPVSERHAIDAWRADVLDRVDAAQLEPLWKARIAMRRASVWSAVAFQRARRGETAPAAEAEQRALAELALVTRGELADGDIPTWDEAAIRVGASRWAASATNVQTSATTRGVRLASAAGEPGQTCVAIVDERRDGGARAVRAGETATRNDSARGDAVQDRGARGDAPALLAKRCTYGIVWAASISVDRSGDAVAVAVQPLEGWRELWLFTRQGPRSGESGGWSVQVLPPATSAPGLGYAEFAGWVPGAKQLLVVRESRNAKGSRRNFEVVRVDTLATERQAGDPQVLGAFQRWQDPAWKRETVSLR